MHDRDIIPLGEEHLHIPVKGCACGPRMGIMGEHTYLFHPSFDHREIWLLAERIMGITCWEHGRYVDGSYKRDRAHEHVGPPPIHFEYSHEKIDPR